MPFRNPRMFAGMFRLLWRLVRDSTSNKWVSRICTDNTPPHARINTLFFVRALHMCDHVAQDVWRASKVILSSVMTVLNIPSTPFPPIFSSPTTSLTPPTPTPTPLTGIRLNPCAASLGDGLLGHLAGPIPNAGYVPL